MHILVNDEQWKLGYNFDILYLKHILWCIRVEAKPYTMKCKLDVEWCMSKRVEGTAFKSMNDALKVELRYMFNMYLNYILWCMSTRVDGTE